MEQGIITHTAHTQLYWSLFGQYTKKQLEPAKKEQIVMSIQKLHLDLDTSMRKRRYYSVFFLPLFLDSICSTTQNILRQAYPKWFASRYGPSSC